jgi:GT2 family glycosyltransferase
MSIMVKVSIIIKTLNEETNITRTISSCLTALAPYDGEIIVADSGSTDRTIETAMQFPITVVQLEDPRERCCGVGPQLGYQHCRGEYIYLLDGDMTLDPQFLRTAIDFLDRNPAVAAVGGALREMRWNLEASARLRRRERRSARGPSDAICLDGGALYRRAAIEQVGYMSDRNLHAFEEYNLGVRLRLKGWQLVRLPDHAVDHYGYGTGGAYRLLWRRVRTRYFLGTGEALRAAIADGHTQRILCELRALRVYSSVLILWATVAAAAVFDAVSALFLAAGACAVPIAAMSAVTRSVSLGIYSVVAWHVCLVGLILGALRVRTPPTDPIRSRILKAHIADRRLLPATIGF